MNVERWNHKEGSGDATEKNVLWRENMLIEFCGKKPRVSSKSFIAPTSTLIGDVTVAEGASIWFGARLRGDIGRIVIGANSSIQDNAVIHVQEDGETIVEENVTVAHGAILHNCILKKGCLIGMNAVVLDNAVVGEQAIVAAGSVVAKGSEIPARQLAMGSPAKPKKEISERYLCLIERGADFYSQLAQKYMEEEKSI
jgi:carbonic anhydrase/acetyltransferase-like protein (isoleucine patch superfamily)